MNRINLSPLAFLDSQQQSPREEQRTDPGSWIEHAIFSPTESIEKFASFVPVHYESGYSYPLIVWLEAAESSGADSLLNTMPLISARNYIGISIQVSDATRFNVTDKYSLQTRTVDAQVIQAIEEIASQYNIAEHRVFVAGCQDAGTCAFRIGLRNPGYFAGTASLGGKFPMNGQPLLDWSISRKMPLFWTQDLKSASFPESLLCQQLKMLFTAGFDVTLRQYPDHCPSARTFSDLNVWIMDQINGTDESVSCCEEL